VLLAAAVAIGLGLGLHYGPISAFSLLGLVVTFAALGVYLLAQVACTVFFWRRHEFNILWHGLVPLGAVAVIVYLFIKSEFPTPPHPLDLAIWIALGWTILGIATVAVLSAVAPDRFARMARIIGDDEPGELMAHERESRAAVV